MNLLWLPYDEERLYELLGTTRGEVFRWVRIDADHTLAAARRTPGLHADRARDGADRAARGRGLAADAPACSSNARERTLTQGHLAQHLLFHALHQTAIPERRDARSSARSDRETSCGCAAPSSARCRSASSTAARASRCADAASAGAARRRSRGVRAGSLSRAPGRRDARPPAAPGPALARADAATTARPAAARTARPAGGRLRASARRMSADGSLGHVGRLPRRRSTEAERRGEIHVRGAAARAAARRASRSARRAAPARARPRSAYNSVLAADGRAVAFESARVDVSAGQARRPDVRAGARPAHGAGRAASATRRPARGAPTRTAYNPSISADGRIVAFEATDSGRNGGAVAQRRCGSSTAARTAALIADGSRGAAFLPRLAGDGAVGRLHPADRAPRRAARWVCAAARARRAPRARLARRRPPAARRPTRRLRAGAVARRRRRSRSSAAPQPGRRRATARASSCATCRAGTTTLVSGGVRGRRDRARRVGRRPLRRVRRARRAPDGTSAGLRSRIWLHDRLTGRTTLVSRARGRGGGVADGYASEPADLRRRPRGRVHLDRGQPRRAQAARARGRVRPRPAHGHDADAQHAQAPRAAGAAARAHRGRHGRRRARGWRAGCAVARRATPPSRDAGHTSDPRALKLRPPSGDDREHDAPPYRRSPAQARCAGSSAGLSRSACA